MSHKILKPGEKMCKVLVPILALLTLASCDTFGEKYTYVPASNVAPATIEFRDGLNPRTVKTLFGDTTHFSYSVKVYRIDGKYIRTDNRQPFNDEPVVLANLVYLNAGVHRIAFEYIGQAVGHTEAELDIKSGEQYNLVAGRDEFTITDRTGNVIERFEVRYF